MTANNDPDDRRSFTSRTPVNDNPDQVQYRRGFVTRHQVSGWRFVMRRIASGIALHDTRMLVDPLRTQSRAVAMGAVLLVTGLAGCFVFSLIRPNGTAGTNAVLADRSTAALYVRVGDDLHPVLNLTSARLIVGKPVNPITVKSAELDRFPRGNLLGIPGAPERMVQNPSTDANWTVCDSVSEPAPGGHGAHSTGVTVIAGRPDSSGARAAALPSQQAILAERDGGTWLLWNGRRSQINLADHAVTNALGLTENNSELPAPRPIALGLFNAIPEAPSLSAPGIPNAGAPAPFAVPAPIGAVVVSYTLDQSSSGARATTRCCPTACSRSHRCWRRSCATPIPMGWTNRRGWAPTRWPSCRCRGCWTPRATRTNTSAWWTPPNRLSHAHIGASPPVRPPAR